MPPERAGSDPRRDLIATVRRMNALGINQGTSGNASVRASNDPAEGFWITPSGMPYDDIEPEDIVRVRFGGKAEPEKPHLKPSSEWRFHHDILERRADVIAIVHTHSRSATALACLHREIPAFHYMVAVAGGSTIRVAPYATFGTQALSDHALAALEGRTACLLANHGVIATGKSLDAALARAVEVETLASMYLQALAVGEPVILGEAEMAEVIEKFKTYGAAASGDR